MSRPNSKVKSFEDMAKDWTMYLALFRSYPDLFIDMILPKDSNFQLYFYQRIILRIIFRYRKTYFTLTRGSSKSFLQILALYLKCIMYPNIKLFITSPQKNMSAQISQQNIQSIWNFMPILKNELREIKFEKDNTMLIFHNNSVLACVANNESSRGLRGHGLSIEEIIHERFDEESFNSVLLPIMANNRIPMCGGEDPYELHKPTTVVTTAGTKQSFAFNLLKEYLMDMVDGKSSFILGSSYELPTSFGLLSLSYINDLKMSPNFNPISFLREYGSIWSGSSENSLVDLETFRQSRILKNAEVKATKDKNISYVLSYDVARSEGNMNAQSSLCVIRLTNRGDNTFRKDVVNLWNFEGSHFREQALFLKQKVDEFDADVLVVDANGLGQGIVDFLILPDLDDKPPFQVINDDRYDKFKTADSIPMVFVVKSQSAETKASDIHNLFIRWVGNGQVKFLESESQARQKYRGKTENMSEFLRPYVMTDFLQEEIMNLEYKQSGSNTTVKQVSKSIQKDRYSALSYGLFWIYKEEQRLKIRRSESVGDIDQFFMGRKPKGIR